MKVKKRIPKKTWNTLPNTVEETLKAVTVLQKWENKTGLKAGYHDGIIVSLSFAKDLCERVIALETAASGGGYRRE